MFHASKTAAVRPATSVRSSRARGLLLASSMLSGFGPLPKHQASRRNWIILAKPAAVAMAAAGLFTSGAAFAQTPVTPANGQGTVTYDFAYQFTDQTTTGGGLTINGPQTVTFSGLNINSGTSQIALDLAASQYNDPNTGAYTCCALTVTSVGAPSTLTGAFAPTVRLTGSTGLTADLGAATISSTNSVGISAYTATGDASLTTTGGSIMAHDYGVGLNGYNVTANLASAITSTNSDAFNSYADGNINLTTSGVISAANGYGISAYAQGTLNFTSTGGSISGQNATYFGAATDITVNSAAAITTSGFGLDAESSNGGAVSLTSSGTIDGANSTAIYASSGGAGTFVVNVNGAVGSNQPVGTGVYAEANAGDATTNTVNVNANISSTGDSVYSDGAGITVNVANGVTLSSTGGFGINNDGGGTLVVNNNGGTVNASSQAILSQHDLTLVNKTGGTLSSSAANGVTANGAANVLNAGTITSSTFSGVVGSVGSVITNATGGSIQGGTDTTYGSAVQLAGQSGTINNYGALTNGAAGSVTVNGNLASTPAGVVAVNLFAGSTTGAINFTNAPTATLSLYNGTGTANAGVTDATTGVVLQNAGTLNAATVGAVTGNFDLVLRGTGDGTAANGAAGTYALATSAGLQSLTKQESGVWNLTGTSAYTGATTIAAGTLALGSSASIASSSGVALTGATSILDTTAYNGSTVSIGTLSGVAGSQVKIGNKGLRVNQATDAIFAGVLSGTPSFGQFEKAGAGKLTLLGANTYTGAVSISAGTLALSSFGSLTGATINNAGTFDISGGFSKSVVSVTGAGAVALGGSNLTLTNASGTISGVITGTRDVERAGGGLIIAGGTETLTGANTYNGATQISSGATLVLGAGGNISYSGVVSSDGALDVSGVTGGYTLIQRLVGASTGTVNLGSAYLEIATPSTFAGVISGTGSLQIDNGPESQLGVFDPSNTGTSTLTGDNTYTGTTYVAGTLRLGAGGTTGGVAGRINLGNTTSILNINRSNAVTLSQIISGTGRLVQSGTGTTTLTVAETYTGLTQVTGGRLALTGAGSVAASAGVNANAVFDISGVTAATSTIKTLSGFGSVVLGSKTLVLNGAGGFSFGGVVSGAGGLTVAGTGVNGLAGLNTYSGATTVSAGATLALSGAGSIAASSGVADNGVLDISLLTNGGASIKTLSGAGAVALGANTLTLTAAADTFSGALNGGGGLTLAGGTQTLSGVNGYTGSTTIAAGTLALSGAASIASSSGVIDNAVFDISGLTNGGAAIAGLTGGGAVQLGANTLLLTNASGVFSGGIAGSGGLTLLGGSQTLNGVSTYTGATNISGGTLIFGSGGSVGSSPISLTAAGATLDVTAQPGFNLGAISGVSGSFVNASGLVTLGSDASTVFASNLTTTGGLTKVGSGTLLLSGTNSFAGPTTVSAGVLAVSGGSAISDNSVVNVASGAAFSVLGSETVANIGGAGQIGLASGAALTFGGDNRASTFGSFSGAGDLIKTGTGLFTLAGVNASTGRTTISGGQIQMQAGGGFAGSVTVGSGASLIGTGAVNGNLTVAAGGTLSPGANPGDFATISAGSLNTAGTIRIDFGGNSTGSKSDKIIVAGAINVAGGVIDAHPTSATNDYTFNQYFALTAGTTFTGQFTNPTDFTTNAYDPRLKQRIRYDLGPAAVLEVRFLQDLTAGLPADGSAGNAGSVALALNGTESGASDAFSVLINALADLSPAARTKALQLLSGEGAVDGQQMAGVAFDGFMGVLSSHLADAGDGSGSAAAFGLFDAQGGGSSRLGGLRALSSQRMLGVGSGIGFGSGGGDRAIRTWAQGFAVDRTLDADGGFAKTTTTGEGFAAGVDAAFGHGITAGVAIGYSNPRSKTSDRLAKADGDSTFGGAYAKWTQGAWFAGVQAGYGSTDLTLQRSVVVGALSFAPRGKTSADSFGLGFSAGYRHVLADGSRVDPIVTIAYGHDSQDAYSETNGGVAGLGFSSVKLDHVTATAGARWAKDYSYRGWRITPDARLAAAVAGGDLNINTGAAFLAAPAGTGAFRVSGAKTPPNWGIVGAGISFAPRDSKLDFRVAYEGYYGSRLTEHHLAATIGYRW